MLGTSRAGRTIDEVRVTMAEDGFYPQTFRWAGRDVRVLSVEGLRTVGFERRFRVRTVEGVYELTHDSRAEAWRMRQSPSWFGRAMAKVAQEPRYTLPRASLRAVRAGSRRSPRRA